MVMRAKKMKQREKSDATVKRCRRVCGTSSLEENVIYDVVRVWRRLTCNGRVFRERLIGGRLQKKLWLALKNRPAHGSFWVQTTTTIREENGTATITHGSLWVQTTTITTEILLPAIIADYFLHGMNGHEKWKSGLSDWVVAEFLSPSVKYSCSRSPRKFLSWFGMHLLGVHEVFWNFCAFRFVFVCGRNELFWFSDTGG